MGAAGRDFHNFNTYFRDNESYEVVGFTAAQIPNIDDRRYPAELAGKLYPKGIPILPEDDLSQLIAARGGTGGVRLLRHLPHRPDAQGVDGAGERADFRLMGNRAVPAVQVPVISVCAVRTGAGKSQPPGRYARFEGAGREWWRSGIPCPTATWSSRRCSASPPTRTWTGTNAPSRRREEYEPLIDNGHRRLRRRGLRAHPEGGGEGGGRDRLGRREQRHLVLPVGPAHRDRRPASARPRDLLSSRGDERAHGGRGDHQQGADRGPARTY